MMPSNNVKSDGNTMQRTDGFSDLDWQHALRRRTVASLVTCGDAELVGGLLRQSSHAAPSSRNQFAVVGRKPEERRFLAVLNDVADDGSATVVDGRGPDKFDGVLLNVLDSRSAGPSGFI
jgi:hypothetical protein